MINASAQTAESASAKKATGAKRKTIWSKNSFFVTFRQDKSYLKLSVIVVFCVFCSLLAMLFSYALSELQRNEKQCLKAQAQASVNSLALALNHILINNNEISISQADQLLHDGGASFDPEQKSAIYVSIVAPTGRTLASNSAIVAAQLPKQPVSAIAYATAPGQAKPYTVLAYMLTTTSLAQMIKEKQVAIFGALLLSILAGYILYAFMVQLSQTKRAAVRLKETKSKSASAMHNSHCGMWDWHLATGKVFWSASLYSLLGYKPQTAPLSIKDINSLIDDETIDLYEMANGLLNKSIEDIDLNLPMRHAQGHCIWLRLRAQVNNSNFPHLIGISFDISDQHHLMREVEQSEQRIREAIENISESFVLWDNTSRLIMCNSKYREYTSLPEHLLQPGVLRAEIADKSPIEYVNDLSVNGLQEIGSYERQINADRWIKISQKRTRDGGLVAIGTDISQLKLSHKNAQEREQSLNQTIQVMKLRGSENIALNSKLETEKEKAEAANKAKSEFLANMSHELRTPLNAIIGFSQMMLSATFGPLANERYQEYINDIHASGEHLLTLINDILDMSKIEAGRFNVTLHREDLVPIIQETKRFFAPTINEKQLSTKINLPDSMLLDVDRRAIKQVFLNIISNAVKFSLANGCITISAIEKDAGVVIQISDEGVSIPKEALAKLGRPFEQVENQFSKTYAGSGLGLAISKSLIELHNGTLNIESQEHCGTTVSIYLPAC